MRLHSWSLPGEPGLEPVIALHGLLGSADNLRGLVGQLQRAAHGLDLRNHGHSPHSEAMSIPLMAEDVLAFAKRQKLARFHLLGHSLGGKVAMQVALMRPELCASLLVIDIAPVDYPPQQHRIIAALRAVAPQRLGSRRAVAEALSEHIADHALAMFLMKNLGRDDDGTLFWRPNLATLAQRYASDLCKAPKQTNGPCPCATLLLCGERSNYVDERGWAQTKLFFPNARKRTIGDAGHWAHSDQPQICREIVNDFFRP